MRICMVLPHFYPYVGGAEKMFYDLAVGLANRGHEVRVVAKRVDALHDGKVSFSGIDVWYCDWRELFGHPLPKRRDVEAHIRWCDIVHTSTFTPAHIVSVLAAKYGKPSVMTVHEVHGDKWYWVDNPLRASGFYLYETYVCRQPYDMYHAVSEATRKDFYRFIAGGRKEAFDVRRVYLANEMRPKETQAPKPIDLYEYFGIDRGKKVFLFYGRPGKTKGIYVYEEAILRLFRASAEASADTEFARALADTRFCFILGSEPAKLRRRFVERVKKNGMETFMPVRDSLDRERLSACILQADYVVVPSVTEGFGLSALEACQMGKRLIYSNAGSLPEVVYGEVLEFKNRDAADLAERLREVIQNGARAFTHIPEKKFTYDAMIGGIEELYMELMKKKKETGRHAG